MCGCGCLWDCGCMCGCGCMCKCSMKDLKTKVKTRQRRATDDPEEVMQWSLLISQPNLLNPLLSYSSIILSS